MSSNVDEVLKPFVRTLGSAAFTTFSLFDVPLSQLLPSSTNCPAEVIVKAVDPSEVTHYTCRVCNSTFISVDAQREHFKTQSHINRLKEGLDDDGDDSEDSDSDSVSSTDSEVNTDYLEALSLTSFQPTKHSGPHHFIPLLSPDYCMSISTALSAAPIASPYITVILLQSGRFAFTVFQAATPLVHKTFRRYTIRAKSGGAQSANDKSKGNAKSAGATLRRHNEAALRDDIQNLLQQHRELIQDSEYIFASVPKTMRNVIFDVKVIRKDDSRLRYIPLAINKPSFEETKRLLSVLTTCYLYKRSYVDSLNVDNSKKSNDEDVPTSNIIAEVHSVPQPAVSSEVVEDTSDLSPIESVIPEAFSEAYQQLLHCCDTSDLATLATLPLTDIVNYITTTSPLHLAAERGSPEIVTLLLEAGADVTAVVRGKCPYHVAKDKSIRDAFRRYRAKHENQWEYDAAGVGAPLTAEMEAAQAEKEKQKKKRQAAKKKEAKAKAEADKAASLRKEEEAVNEALAHNIALSGFCDQCNKSLYKVEPFVVFDARCCSTACVALMRRKLAAEAAEKRFRSK